MRNDDIHTIWKNDIDFLTPNKGDEAEAYEK